MLEAVAFRQDDGQREVRAFVGPATAMWNLPSGTYRISAINDSGVIYELKKLHIMDVPVIWPDDFNLAGGSENNPQP